MCFSDIGVQTFRNYDFNHSKWIHYQDDTKKNFIVKKSNIQNAGDGLFLAKKSKTIIQALKLFDYQGEPLEQWYYEALEYEDNIFTGVKINIPKIGNCIFRGIPNTLGVKINAAMKEQDANVEFVIDFTKINHKTKTIDGDGLISIYKKPHCIIKPGDELLLYYGKQFWKNHKNHKEAYCVICISFDSHLKNRIVLCDGCDLGYHERCLLKFNNNKKEHIPKGKWFCFHCKSI